MDPPYQRENLKKMRVIVAAEELELYTYRKCRSTKVFPKKDRGALPVRMCNEASDILADIMDANDYDLRDAEEARLRIQSQRSALRTCRLLIHHITLVHNLGLIDDNVFEYWSLLANSVRNQAAAWHKKDKERYKQFISNAGNVL